MVISRLRGVPQYLRLQFVKINRLSELSARSISEEFSSGEVKSHEDGLEQKNSRESSKKKQSDEQDDGNVAHDVDYVCDQRRCFILRELHSL